MGTTLIDDPSRPPKASRTTLVERPQSGTRLATPGPAVGAANGPEAIRRTNPDAGPVVGWLVVVDGPGRGRSVELGYGMNIVGRGPANRIVLDFGDDQISTDDHFRIAYDGAHRRFHLVPGRGTNLVYLAGAPLLSPVPLDGHAEIRIGSTVLRFVALCGDAWDWGQAEGGSVDPE